MVKQSAKVDESPAVLLCYCQFDVQVVERALFPTAGLDKVEGRYKIVASTSIGKDTPRSRKSGTLSEDLRQ